MTQDSSHVTITRMSWHKIHLTSR